MVDVLILTHNEELNVPHTLASVAGLAHKVFVLDSHSTDQTAAIAERAGATVVEHAWEGYAAQKNWALDNLPFESPWILILDADESLTPTLAEEIRQVIQRPPQEVRESGFYLNRVLIFMGRPIRHCGYFPSWNIRLFKRGSARYEQRQVHEHMIVDGPLGHFRGLMRHEDRRGLEHYIAKHNRYSTLEARELYRQDAPWPGFSRFFSDRVARRRFVKYRLATKIATPWLWRFFYMYIFRFGFLDGQSGLCFCLFISSYELFIRMKYQDLRWSRGLQQAGISGLAIPEGGLQSDRRSAAQLPQRALAIAQPVSAARTVPAPRPNAAAIDFSRPVAKPRGQPMMRQSSPWTFSQKAARVAWGSVQGTVFRLSPHNAYGWRAFLLKLFGARLGKGVRVRRTVQIEIPWNLTIGDYSVVGDWAILYCLGPVTIGRFVTISQYAHLCAGTHETHTRRMELLRPPITIGDDVWVAADAFVGPGVTIGDRAILGARASAFKDIPADMVAVGNPAVPIKSREFTAEEISVHAAAAANDNSR
jgi:acetyltransferase-like isoleucine patch superfamily enzyme/glycosyltransferase involved in cell wall biosynthesis